MFQKLYLEWIDTLPFDVFKKLEESHIKYLIMFATWLDTRLNMDDTKIIDLLKVYVMSHGSQKNAAEALGISTQYLNDLLRGRRNVSEEIAGKFGFHAEWVLNERFLTKREPDAGNGKTNG